MNKRTLSLKREVLAEIDGAALARVGGGETPTKDTCFSCMTYVSCWITDCYFADTDICFE